MIRSDLTTLPLAKTPAGVRVGRRALCVLMLGLALAGCRPGGDGPAPEATAAGGDAAGVASASGPISLVQRAPTVFAESARRELAARQTLGVERTMSRFFVNRRAEPVPYETVGADLDGDGQAEAVVLVEGEGFCVRTGCTLLVLKAVGGDYRIFATVKRVKRPVVISHRSSRGWRDLYVRTGGGGMRLMTVALQFSAAGYPANASVLKPFLGDARANGEVVFDQPSADGAAPATTSESGQGQSANGRLALQ